jgi:hypothetical protein
MGRGIAHSGRRFATDKYSAGALDDAIRWSDTDTGITHHGRRQVPYQDGGDTGTDNRATDMRNRRNPGGYHGAAVHIG